jgi:hypothetical protein
LAGSISQTEPASLSMTDFSLSLSMASPKVAKRESNKTYKKPGEMDFFALDNCQNYFACAPPPRHEMAGQKRGHG